MVYIKIEVKWFWYSFFINFFYFVDEIDVGYFFGVLGGNIADKIIDNIKI